MNDAEHVTLRTLARETGLSVSGVSLALRGSPKVSPQTRERVRRVAEELGYRPHPMVSALMAHVKSGRPTAGVAANTAIAWLNQTRDEDFWHRFPYTRPFLEGAQKRAKALGFHLEEFWTRQPGMSGRRLDQILKARNIRGVIPTQSNLVAGHVSLPMNHYAAATFQHGPARPVLHRACANYFLNTQTSLRELRKRGHSRIGLFLSSVQDRFTDQGVTSAFLQHQRSPGTGPPDLLHCGKIPSEEAEAACRRYVRRHKPDVVLCIDNRIPGFLADLDVAVAHVGLTSAEAEAGTSGIDLHAEAIAAATVDSVVAQLHRNEHGNDSAPKLILIEGHWVPGHTA